MEEWLKNLWHDFRHRKLGLAILFLLVLSVALNLVALVSDIGFAEEIRNYRFLILEITLIAAFIFILASYHIRIFQERNRFRRMLNELQDRVNDLDQQKESAFRLMERYKGEAQEDILNRLKQLAIFSLKQHEWRKKYAKIDRFRVEESLEAVS